MWIRELNVTDAADFAAWHRTMREAYSHQRQVVWWSSLDQERRAFATASPRRHRVAAGAFDSGACLGGLELELPDDEDTHTASLELGVRPDERGRGVGAALWHWAVARCHREGRIVVQAEVTAQPGLGLDESPDGRFALARGFAAAHVERRMILDLRGSVGGSFRDPGVAPPAGYRITSWAGACPEALVGEFARLSTLAEQDIPFGRLSYTPRAYDLQRVREVEQRMTELGWTLVRSMALDSQARGVGFTAILVSRDQPELLIQEDTLVAPRHRRRGLSLALKSANLNVAQSLPEPLSGRMRWLQTYTATTNTPMLEANERFGFRVVDVLHECEVRLRPTGGPGRR